MVIITITFENMICVSKRENNTSRSFLFLNKFQAKYVPTDPNVAIEVFSKIKPEKSAKKTVVIGFCETATAIGAVVCKNLGNNAFYIHSTRESLENLPKVHFREEHSHAKNHELCLKNIEHLKSAERFIFVDDEFTTGKTALNFIEALKANDVISKNAEICVATIVNCMENTEIFDEKGIKYNFVLCENRDFSKTTWNGEIIEDNKVSSEDIFVKTHIKNDYLDSRMGVFIDEYDEKINDLCEFVKENVSISNEMKNILVLGTEEFMYPAIMLSKFLKEQFNADVKCHATSRSPILPLSSSDYAIKNRTKITSFYDEKRQVYLYNTQKYDKVIILTDSKNIGKKAQNEIINLLKSYGNDDIDLVIWRDDENFI